MKSWQDIKESLKLKKIDYYIIGKFLGTYVYAIVLIVTVAVVFDLSEKINDFIEKQAPLKAILFDYYLNFIPYFAILFSSLFTFIAVVFFTSRMASRTEIIAILSSGISFRRMLWPYFISASLIAAYTYVMYDYVIPDANKKRFAFEDKYYHDGPKWYGLRNTHKQLERGLFAFLESYSTYTNTGYRFTLERFEGSRLVSKLTADYISWDSAKHKWNVRNYYIRNISAMGDTIIRGQSIDTMINLSPEDFSRRNNAMEAMNHRELNQFIAELELQGSEEIKLYRIERYKRVATPFSTLILTLIAVSLSSRKMRGGLGIHLSLGFLLCFSYIFFMQMSSQFAIGGSMNPLLAVWLPNLIYVGIGWFLYKKAPK